ncbi:Hypothetical predicted protein [Paramuricea clavata]|uniref:Uncharacterized protein n=1 Tax=Paramuricea clavata TaxID=317549 RepID=A0A6S7KNA0_PARCT|nr:Hypothetical predicted protein [Paramuricea clavata]
MAGKQGQGVEVLLLSNMSVLYWTKWKDQYSKNILQGRFYMGEMIVLKNYCFSKKMASNIISASHIKAATLASDRESYLRICRKILKDETRKCFEMLFNLRESLGEEYRKIQVRSYGRSMTCIAKHDKEAAQFMGLLLYYAGILQAYSKGNKPSDIHVTSEGLEVKFHSWYLKECNQES